MCIRDRDNAVGPLVGEGTVPLCTIEPGFHATQTIAFDAPKVDGADRTLCLVLEVVKDGPVVNRDDHTRLTITAR